MNVWRECARKIKNVGLLFISILALNFCIWIKVSTDLFVVFAPFLCLNIIQQDEKGETVST